MRRVFSDALISLAALGVLLFGLIAVDDNVRERVVSVLHDGNLAANAGNMLSTAGHLTSVLFIAVRDQSLDHAPLAVFVVAGTALMLAMLRL